MQPLGASITQFRTPLNPGNGWPQCLLRWNLSPDVHYVAPRRCALLPVGWLFVLGPCPPYVKAATTTTPDRGCCTVRAPPPDVAGEVCAVCEECYVHQSKGIA